MLKDKLSINKTTFKIIAIITMIIDHVGYYFYDDIGLFRIIGRISLPLFIYMLVDGYFKTKSLKKYFKRLLYLAIISQIPFLIFTNFSGYFNCIFQLINCLVMVMFLEFIKNENYKNVPPLSIVILFSFIGYFLKLDYTCIGSVYAYCFYQHITKKDSLYWIFTFAFISFLYGYLYSTFQIYSILSIPLILVYNCDLTYSKKIEKYSLYIYPVQFIILIILKYIQW